MNAEDLDRLAAARADRGMTVPLDRLIQALLIGFLSGAETGPTRLARSGVGPYDVFPPNPKAQAVAKAYHDDAAGRLGLPAYQPLGSQLKVNENASRRAALVFAALRHDPSDPMVQKSYAAFKKEIVAQYLNMLRHGVKVHRAAPGEHNYLQMHNDLLKTGGMSYEPTAVTGFGTHAGFEDNPLHEQVPGMPKGVLYNDLFRVIHDYYGHAPHGHDFSPTGELRAWHEHARMFSPLARRAMTTETHGQNSWLHFGPHIEGHETSDQKPYADQKAALMPHTEWPLRFARPGEPVSHVYVSPSTREGSTFPQAYQGIDSPDMGALTAATPGGKSGYGVWHDGAEEVRHWPLTNPVVADAEASRIGKLFKQKAALVFHEGVGPDVLHILRVPVTDPERIARELEEHGVQFKTILPEQGASEVHVVDFGGQMGKALADYAKRSGALSYTTRPGTAREIPTA